VPLTLVAGLGHWWMGSVDWALLASLFGRARCRASSSAATSAAACRSGFCGPTLAAMLVLVAGRLIVQ